VKATLGTDNAQTKGDNITFGTSTTNLTIMASNTGVWRITKEVATTEAAEAWCDKKLGKPSAPQNPPDPPGGGSGS
jgi:hypothetical protein